MLNELKSSRCGMSENEVELSDYYKVSVLYHYHLTISSMTGPGWRKETCFKIM